MRNQMQHIADVSSAPATYVAAATAVGVGGLTSGEWQVIGVIGGLILGTLTYLTSLYFRMKQDKRQEEALKNR